MQKMTRWQYHKYDKLFYFSCNQNRYRKWHSGKNAINYIKSIPVALRIGIKGHVSIPVKPGIGIKVA